MELTLRLLRVRSRRRRPPTDRELLHTLQMALALLWIAFSVLQLTAGADKLWAVTGFIWVGRYVWTHKQRVRMRDIPTWKIDWILLAAETAWTAAYWVWVLILGG